MHKRMLEAGLAKPKVRPPSKAQLRRREIERLSTRFDPEKLYKEVWQKPVQEGAQSCRVSGVYLGRVYRALNVPAPPRGYWARVRSGEAVKKPELPKLRA